MIYKQKNKFQNSVILPVRRYPEGHPDLLIVRMKPGREIMKHFFHGVPVLL